MRGAGGGLRRVDLKEVGGREEFVGERQQERQEGGEKEGGEMEGEEKEGEEKEAAAEGEREEEGRV